MKDYDCYQKLCFMESIAFHYVCGRNSAEVLRNMREEISDKVYRVAFVGEFNHGKSSLINALLGSDVLPMDVMPNTATVIRVIYGETRRMRLIFKDGREEESDPEVLQAVATKRDDESEEIAADLREVVVEYPSVLCGEHIQILDTPGINESENMSEVTRDVLKGIDAAVVVLSAKNPLSMTERELILDMIAEEGIRHLIFAVTFIDVLDSEERKDKQVAFIANRLSKMTSEEETRSRFAGNDALLKKFEKLLGAPSVFGVSALEARRALHKDSRTLLKQSRLPVFKENLISFLTAAQREDLPAKTLGYLEWMIEELPKWNKEERIILRESLTTGVTHRGLNFPNENVLTESLESSLSEFDCLTKSLGLTESYVNIFCKTRALSSYLAHIGEVYASDDLDFKISGVLKVARDEILEEIASKRNIWEKMLHRYMKNVERSFQDRRREAKLDAECFEGKLSAFHEGYGFPTFSLASDPLPAGSKDHLSDIYNGLTVSTEIFWENVKNRLDMWKNALYTQLGEDIGKIRQRNAKDLETKLKAMPFLYKQQMDSLWAMQDELDPGACVRRKTEVQEEDGPQKTARLIRELQEEYGGLPSLFFRDGSDASRRKIAGAINGYAGDVSYEDVIFCYDDTFFGSCDNGFLMTGRKFCVMNFLENPVSIPLMEIQTITTDDEKFGQFVLNTSGDGAIRLNLAYYMKNPDAYYKLRELMLKVIEEFSV